LILKILKKYNAKATFFVTGCHQEYNQYIIEAYKQGHTIGLHSYLHEYQDIYSSKDAYFKDLKKIKQMVKQLIGIQVHYIRFPGGSSNRISKNYCHGIMSQLTREVIKQGYQYYDWNGDTTDASGNHIPTATIIKQATSETHQNIVLLAHDTDAKDTTVAALPSIIQYYKEKGNSKKIVSPDKEKRFSDVRCRNFVVRPFLVGLFSFKEEYRMTNIVNSTLPTPNNHSEKNKPDGVFVIKQGKTNYKVKVFFDHSSGLTAEDRLKRIIQAEAERESA